MQRKVVKKIGYNAGKSKSNQELIYLHMSNHYRRILNAKKVVDNSPPRAYRTNRTSNPKRPSTTNTALARTKLNRPLDSPALTDRSISTNSYRGSCWGTDSNFGSSRYHSSCIPSDANNNSGTRHGKRPGVDMDLVDRITYDTKNGPAAYCDESWMQMKERSDKAAAKSSQPAFGTKGNKTAAAADSSADRQQQQQNKSRPPVKGGEEPAQKQKFNIQKKPRNSEERNKENKTFVAPKVSKTEAVSKLRSMRVYHPPRRRKARVRMSCASDFSPRMGPADHGASFDEISPADETKIETPSNSVGLEGTDCECTKICICETTDTVFKKGTTGTKEQSQTSSRDSAYNGGVSSLPESRSPTPDHRRKQKTKEQEECCCCCCEKKEREREIREMRDSKDNKGTSIPPSPRTKAAEQQESLRKMKEDAMYVKFVQDITVEVLERNLYTNKALKKVMKKHLRNNLHKLNKERMLEEVEKLRIQLGIPEDKALLDVEGDKEEEASHDSFRAYPIISDSEFSLPKNLRAEAEAAPPRIPKSISEVLERETQVAFPSETEDEDLVSVLQTKKAVAEKKREKAASGGHSSDDSDRPSQPKKRSTGKQKAPRRYPTTSSDSETSGEKFSGKGCVRECVQGCSCGGADRRSRSVSFWNNADLKT